MRGHTAGYGHLRWPAGPGVPGVLSNLSYSSQKFGGSEGFVEIGRELGFDGGWWISEGEERLQVGGSPPLPHPKPGSGLEPLAHLRGKR